MTRNTKRIVAFSASLTVLCALAWLGGYDFDTRSPVTAFTAAVFIYISAVAGAVAGLYE